MDVPSVVVPVVLIRAEACESVTVPLLMVDAAPRATVPLLVMERFPPDIVKLPLSENVPPELLALVKVPEVIVRPAMVSALAPASNVPPAIVTKAVFLIWLSLEFE